MVNSNYFHVGGTLSSDNNSYVVRQADRELLDCLLEGNFCFVLNCRQMGKSSLMVKTADKLRTENISCAFSDLSVLGITDVSPEQWYKSFAYQLLESLDLDEIDLDVWWSKYRSLTAINCLEKFVEQVILTELPHKIVIFIDEIDSVIRLPFKDDFFALIRGFYNKRTINDRYKRLTFCLLGVATPPDLIADKVRTPFNIGHPIALSGFTVEEAKDALVPGFSPQIAKPEAILKEVIKWTGGQPFLTQKLCLLIAKHSSNTTPNVSEIVKKYMVNDWETQDYPQHFKTISDRLLASSHYTSKLLELYQQILQHKTIIADDSLAQNRLRISGLVNKKDNYLKVYNPIYELIFNLAWIQEQFNKIRPYSSQINKWLRADRSQNYLLNESELIEALEWAENRNISSEDHLYLSASREYSIQQKSQRELFIAKQEKNKIIAQTNKVLLTTVAIAIMIITGSTLFARNRGDRAEISQLDKNSNAALQEFNNGAQIAGLVEAIAINSRLKNKIKKQQDIIDYPTINPVVDLNQIINQIQEKNVIQIDDSAITHLVFSPDGRLIAGNEAGLIKVWNPQSYQIDEWNSAKDRGKVTGIAISSDEREIYVVNRQSESVITVYARNGSAIAFFKTGDVVCSLAVSSDNEFIVSGNDSGELTLWSKEGREIKTKSAHEGIVKSIAISPDNNLIATTGNDTTAKIWSRDGTLITTLSGKDIGHRDSVNSVTFSPDGQTIATASSDNTIKLWKIDGSYIETLLGHNDAVNSVTFSPDGQTIATASSDKTIKLWNRKGETLQTIKGHPSQVKSITFSPDGNTFASGDDRGTIKVWQTDSFQTFIDKAVLLDRQKQLFLNNPQGIEIRNLTGEIIERFPRPQGKLINAIDVRYHKMKRIAIIGTNDGIIARLNPQQLNPWQLFSHRYQGKVIAIDIHPSGKKFITLGINKSQDRERYVIKEWNVDGNLIKTFNSNNEEEITAITYNSQGGRIAIAKKGGIELWDSEGNRFDSIVDEESDRLPIEAIAISPDARSIATLNSEGAIQLREINGKLLATFTNRENRPLVNLDFTADSKTIQSVDRYGKVATWHLDVERSISKGCNWLEDYLVTQSSISITGCPK